MDEAAFIAAFSFSLTAPDSFSDKDLLFLTSDFSKTVL